MRYLMIVVGYLLGSIPFGYLVSKYWKGINILEHGSGNIGFTNVLRTVGWPPALLVLTGDICKGALATWLGLRTGGELFGVICGMAAMIGHSFSVFLNFKGGKLVATALGVLLILTPQVGAVAAVAWLFTLAVTRYVSLSSIMAAVSVVPAMFLLGESTIVKIFLSIAAIFLIYRHRANISRLIKGNEYKIGQQAGRK